MSSLICDWCLKEFGDNDKSEKAPRMLLCGHTFCSKCLKEKKNQNGGKLICKIDGKEDERDIDNIPFNKIIFDILLKQKEKNQIINKRENTNEKIKYKLNLD